MTLKEFTDRTGIELDDEQMGCIHEVYVSTNDDKDYFCALLKAMFKADRCCIEYMLTLGRSLKNERKLAAEALKASKRNTANLKDFLYSQIENPAKSEIRNKLKNFCGEIEYYATCIEKEIQLTQDELMRVAEIIRNNKQ